MSIRFNEKALTQAAAVLLRREGGKMNYMKLLKLLYIADRKSLIEANKQISGDRLVAMDNGPLLSRAYDLLKEGKTQGAQGFWCEHIATKRYEAVLKTDPGNGALSEADERRLNEVYNQLGGMDERELVSWTHNPENVPEWRDPHGSVFDINTRDIFYISFNAQEASRRERDLFQQTILEQTVQT